MEKRITLYADKGKVLTNGTDYGKIIYLASGVSADDYYEITEEEYNKIIEEESQEQI